MSPLKKKKVKDLYNENCSILKKAVGEDIRKQNGITCFGTGRINIIKMATLLIMTHRFNTTPSKYQQHSYRSRKNNPTIYLELEEIQNSQSNPIQREKSNRDYNPGFQVIPQSYNN